MERKVCVTEKLWEHIWIQHPKIHQKQTYFLIRQNLCWPELFIYSTVPPEKLNIAQLIKWLSTFYETKTPFMMFRQIYPWPPKWSQFLLQAGTVVSVEDIPVCYSTILKWNKMCLHLTQLSFLFYCCKSWLLVSAWIGHHQAIYIYIYIYIYKLKNAGAYNYSMHWHF